MVEEYQLPPGRARRRRTSNLRVGDLFDLMYGNRVFARIEKITVTRKAPYAGYWLIVCAQPDGDTYGYWKTKASRTQLLGPRTMPWVWVTDG